MAKSKRNNIGKLTTSGKGVRSKPADLIIDDGTPNDVIFPKDHARGMVPRDRTLFPQEMCAPPSEMKVLPRSEWSVRIKERKERGQGLTQLWLRSGQPCLDQNGDGYCWQYGTAMCAMLARMKAGEPFVRLNPHSIAAITKRGRDEGGWCGLGLKGIREIGCAPEGNGPGQWPLHSRDLRHDTPGMRKVMALYRTLEEWADLAAQVYDQNLTFEQIVTCLLQDIPVQVDYNEWGHSICATDVDEIERGVFVLEILNSWTLRWGNKGFGKINRSWTVDGAIAVRTAA